MWKNTVHKTDSLRNTKFGDKDKEQEFYPCFQDNRGSTANVTHAD